MRLRDAYRDSLDPAVLELIWRRMRLLGVNAAAIAAFPVLTKLANPSPILEGPELSAVISALVFYTLINLSVRPTTS